MWKDCYQGRAGEEGGGTLGGTDMGLETDSMFLPSSLDHSPITDDTV